MEQQLKLAKTVITAGADSVEVHRWFDETYIETGLRSKLCLPDVVAAICRHSGRVWDRNAPADPPNFEYTTWQWAWLERDRFGTPFCIVLNQCTAMVLAPESYSGRLVADAEARAAASSFLEAMTDATRSRLCLVTVSALCRARAADIRMALHGCIERTTASKPVCLSLSLNSTTPLEVAFRGKDCLSSTGERMWAGMSEDGRHRLLLLQREHDWTDCLCGPSPLSSAYPGYQQTGEDHGRDPADSHLLVVATEDPVALDWDDIRDCVCRFVTGDFGSESMLLSRVGSVGGARYACGSGTVEIAKLSMPNTLFIRVTK